MRFLNERNITMTVKELIKELATNFDSNDLVRIDGDCLRISSEVCDSLIKIGTSNTDKKQVVTCNIA